MRTCWRSTLALAVLLFTGVSWTVMAQAEKTAADRVYTDAQAQRGKTVYDGQCAPCHGADAAGGLGPPLAGADFLRAWDKRPLIDLADKIEKTMPATNPGRSAGRRRPISSRTCSRATRSPRAPLN